MSYEDDLLTINEAARRSGKSIMTIRKYLGLTGLPSKLPNARKILKPGDKQETWAIPFSDLFNAGLMDSNAPKAETKKATENYDPIDPLTSLLLKQENEALKKEIARLEAHLASLEETIRFSRRAIETAEAQDRRRKFWQR